MGQSDDSKKTQPFVPVIRRRARPVRIPLPTPIPAPIAFGFIGLVTVEDGEDGTEVTVDVVRGKLGPMDREAIAVEMQYESGRQVRSVRAARRHGLKRTR